MAITPVMIVLLLFISLSAARASAEKSRKFSTSFDCPLAGEPPFLYISTHDEVQNVLKYSRDGCLLSAEVLASSARHALPSFMELRSMAFGRFFDGEREHENALFVADAVSEHSSVHVFSNCLCKNGTIESSNAKNNNNNHNHGSIHRRLRRKRSKDSSQSNAERYAAIENAAHAQRELLGTLLSSRTHAGLDHTYGLAIDAEQRLFVSSQHTDNVLWFWPDRSSPAQRKSTSYVPGEIPLVLRRPTGRDGQRHRYRQPDHWYDHFPGTFFQFGAPKEHSRDQQGVRGVLLLHRRTDGSLFSNNNVDSPSVPLKDTHDHRDHRDRRDRRGHRRATAHNSVSPQDMDTLQDANDFVSHRRLSPQSTFPHRVERTLVWICNEDIDGVLLVDGSTGLAVSVVPVHNPINLVFDPVSQRVFVSSKRRHWRGAVFAVDAHTLRIVAVYTNDEMDHPTGIAVHDGVLYVGVQERAHVLRFDVRSKKYLGVAVKHVPGEIEHILFSPC